MVKSVEDLSVKDRRVFLRVDFNVPIKNGTIKDDTRIVEALETINYLKNKGAKIILASHLGRPKGEFNSEFSLKPVAEYISSKFFPIKFVDDCVGEKVKNAVLSLNGGEVLLLENLRFYKGEEKNYPDFAKELASLADVYVNDAFGTCHRKHASVYGVPEILSEKGAGFLVQKEVRYFEKLLKNAERSFVAILGGAKVSDKIGVIKSLINMVDKILIGGAMAYTFLQQAGHSVGNSLVESEFLGVVEESIAIAKEKGVKIVLPVDHLCSKEFGGVPEYVGSIDIPEGFMGLDIGSKTIDLFNEELKSAKTVLWNGPMGVFENEDYNKGTFAIAEGLAKLGITVVVGGGDSVSAVKKAGVADKISHISTGGGASLEYIEFGSLPGIDILK
ncbi:MAG: phosphoglycerate kinase [Calditerrivibrio sp.]|nr:phosphoglycerate kinase [Calditerrivibrio sp.]MCA1932672.1 phosphoglycerate kinase [Calditerrivibrio sp.]MCA1980352.1 phosphoglycerate kinase [Calditerrivibrio sp.]